jgi:hypothetical protein
MYPSQFSFCRFTDTNLAALKEGDRGCRKQREPGSGDAVVRSGASSDTNTLDADYTAASELIQQGRGKCDE